MLNINALGKHFVECYFKYLHLSSPGKECGNADGFTHWLCSSDSLIVILPPLKVYLCVPMMHGIDVLVKIKGLSHTVAPRRLWSNQGFLLR